MNYDQPTKKITKQMPEIISKKIQDKIYETDWGWYVNSGGPRMEKKCMEQTW